MRVFIFQAFAFIGLFPDSAFSQSTSELSKTLNEPIRIERITPLSTLPLTVTGQKIFLDARISDEPGRFVFDTGSPTLLTRDFADRIGVTYIGQNSGLDANGSAVIMDVAIADTITLGNTVFHDVPVLVSDFARAPLAKCLLGNGVIGSEIMAGSAWRIDLEAKRLTVAASAKAAGASADALIARLYDFGYPHMPVVDYAIGKLKDKALFDTGNAASLALYRPIIDTEDVKSSIRMGSLETGKGSEGVSAGGLGNQVDLYQFDLSEIHLGDNKVRDLPVISRTSAPTLIGAGFLDQFIVTLDFVRNDFLFEPRRTKAKQEDPADYSLMVVNRALMPMQIFEGSRVKAAGLRLGDRIVNIDGQDTITNSDAQDCEMLEWLQSEFEARSAKTFAVLRDGEPHKITLSETP